MIICYRLLLVTLSNMSKTTKEDIRKLAEYENELFEAEHVEVAPGIYQSLEAYEGNQAYDEMKDNELQEKL